MLSCIICSRHSDISPELKQNIQTTIGVAYELVVIDNSRNEYSIFSAYNEGVRRAKGDIFCFMHEDIEYVTPNWGSIVQREMQNPQVGCIGVAGTYFMPSFAAKWWDTCASVGQWIYQSLDGTQIFYDLNNGVVRDSSISAAVVDGLWMCIRASLFSEISFDERTYSGGFHCYDLDICMQVHALDKEVRVLSNIHIIHYSMGNVKGDFSEKLAAWSAKWQSSLPIYSIRWGGKIYAQDRDQLLKTFREVVAERDKRYKRLIDDLYASKAYRLGHFLLKPYRFYKRLLNKRNNKT